MLFCERCRRWLHGRCVGVTKKSEPEHFFCPVKARDNALALLTSVLSVSFVLALRRTRKVKWHQCFSVSKLLCFQTFLVTRAARLDRTSRSLVRQCKKADHSVEQSERGFILHDGITRARSAPPESRARGARDLEELNQRQRASEKDKRDCAAANDLCQIRQRAVQEAQSKVSTKRCTATRHSNHVRIALVVVVKHLRGFRLTSVAQTTRRRNTLVDCISAMHP